MNNPRQFNYTQQLEHRLNMVKDDLECPYVEKEYNVTVTRVSTSTKQITVVAPNHEDAKDMAIQSACDMEFTEQSYEYEIDDVISKEQEVVNTVTNKSNFRLT